MNTLIEWFKENNSRIAWHTVILLSLYILMTSEYLSKSQKDGVLTVVILGFMLALFLVIGWGLYRNRWFRQRLEELDDE